MVFLIITSEVNGHHFHHSSNTSKAKNKKHGANDSVKGVPAHTLTGVCALEKYVQPCTEKYNLMTVL